MLSSHFQYFRKIKKRVFPEQVRSGKQPGVQGGTRLRQHEKPQNVVIRSRMVIYDIHCILVQRTLFIREVRPWRTGI